MSKICVIGGCGRIGLKTSLICANKGHKVLSIDIDEERITEIKNRALPFIENGLEPYLEKAIKSNQLILSTEYEKVSEQEIIIITVGTPVDSNLNPSIEPVAGIIFDIAEYLKKDQLIVFRNIISPSVVNRIKTLIEDKTGYKIGKDIYVVFAPEPIDENQNINDLENTPQYIGAFDEESYAIAKSFFSSITKGKISYLMPEEALLTKLMKNMYSYIKTACGNEFLLIAESYGGNYHKILDSLVTEKDISNPPLPSPNSNASGPGMHKEGWYLVERIPFTELITTAFKINESIPANIIEKLEKYKVKKVAILGMASKPNSDEVRSSLSYKLRKLLLYKSYEVGCYDPYLPEFSDSSALYKADAVILMTPHERFKDIEELSKLINSSNFYLIDPSNFWNLGQESGIFYKLNDLRKVII